MLFSIKSPIITPAIAIQEAMYPSPIRYREPETHPPANTIPTPNRIPATSVDRPTGKIFASEGVARIQGSEIQCSLPTQIPRWTLSVYGHEDAKLMDGAWELWKAEFKTVSLDSPAVEASSYAFTAAKNESLIISMDRVLSSLSDSSSVVLDTRSADEYVGRDERAERGGHVPSSIHVEWVQNVDADGRFLPAADLKSLYGAANVSDDLDIYTLCQTAVRATHSWFVLADLLGYGNVSVYDGSWTEWGNNKDIPIDS